MGRAAGLETHTSNPWAAGHAEALLHVGNRVECCRAAGLRCSRLLGLLELGCTRGRYGGGPTCDPLKSENHHTTQYFAITAAWVGEKELALQQLESWTACSRRIGDAELRCLKTVPFLGPAPRRSALRENRRVVSAEKTVKLNHAVLRKGATLDVR